MNKDIIPKNELGKVHGYCEFYYASGQLGFKGVWVNHKRCGYCVYSHSDGSMNKTDTGYYLNNNEISDTNDSGYCYIWLKVIV